MRDVIDHAGCHVGSPQAVSNSVEREGARGFFPCKPLFGCRRLDSLTRHQCCRVVESLSDAVVPWRKMMKCALLKGHAVLESTDADDVHGFLVNLTERQHR